MWLQSAPSLLCNIVRLAARGARIGIKTTFHAIQTIMFFEIGGATGNRTPDLLNAIQALSHLSYDPTGCAAMGAASSL